MKYEIDKSFFVNGFFSFFTESNIKFFCRIVETAPQSDVYTFSFNSSGKIKPNEIFSVMTTLSHYISEFLEKVGIKKGIVFITGQNYEEIDSKTRIFSRWFIDKTNFNVEKINSSQHPLTRTETNTEVTVIRFTLKENKQLTKTKFCFNCGSANKEDYKFCPNCGQNLQQA